MPGRSTEQSVDVNVIRHDYRGGYRVLIPDGAQTIGNRKGAGCRMQDAAEHIFPCGIIALLDRFTSLRHRGSRHHRRVVWELRERHKCPVLF